MKKHGGTVGKVVCWQFSTDSTIQNFFLSSPLQDAAHGGNDKNIPPFSTGVCGGLEPPLVVAGRNNEILLAQFVRDNNV